MAVSSVVNVRELAFFKEPKSITKRGSETLRQTCSLSFGSSLSILLSAHSDKLP